MSPMSWIIVPWVMVLTLIIMTIVMWWQFMPQFTATKSTSPSLSLKKQWSWW